MYPEEIVTPMRQELTNIGFVELRTPDEVDKYLSDQSGTTLLVINSVCGCAAGNARPGVRMALGNDKKPDHLVTVFAGQDGDATMQARTYLKGYPPSSPSMALFRNGQLVHMIPRLEIEGRMPEQVATNLKSAFDSFCE